MTSLLYPTLQALDIQHTKSDIFFGDSNQREIYRFADKTLCKLGYNKRTYFLNDFNDVIKDLNNISFLDSYEKIKEKIYSFKFGIIIELFISVIYDICEIKKIDIIINNIKLNKFDDLFDFYNENKINKENIYDFVIEIINDINEPIRKEFNELDVKEKLAAADY